MYLDSRKKKKRCLACGAVIKENNNARKYCDKYDCQRRRHANNMARHRREKKFFGKLDKQK